MSLSEHYPVLAAQLCRWPGDDKDEPEDDDGLTGPIDEDEDPRAKEQNAAMREEEERERDFIMERAKEQAEREDAADLRRELARFDAEGRAR